MFLVQVVQGLTMQIETRSDPSCFLASQVLGSQAHTTMPGLIYCFSVPQERGPTQQVRDRTHPQLFF